jgi:hypothetical protein
MQAVAHDQPLVQPLYNDQGHQHYHNLRQVHLDMPANDFSYVTSWLSSPNELGSPFESFDFPNAPKLLPMPGQRSRQALDAQAAANVVSNIQAFTDELQD